jgi:drug/metabolite transporter (DMT)-like permease
MVLGSVACVVWSPGAGLGFRWRWEALLWMVLGAAAGWYLWVLIDRLEAAPNLKTRKQLVFYCVLLLLGGLAVFAYPFRFVPPEKFRDVLIGLAAALFVLSFAGWMLFRLFRALSKSDSPSQQPPKV